jgi:hypothetical protein
MRKHWIALLSMLGLAGSAVAADAQVIKGSQPEPTTQKNPATKNTTKQGVLIGLDQPGAQKNAQQKLQVNQQKLRQQNQAAGTAGLTKAQANTGTCKQSTGVNNANKLTPPPPGQNNQQLTKGNQQLTKGNQQVTKGNNLQITKGNQQVTKGSNQAITKGNQQLTKGNQALTKANNQAITKANVPK